MAKLYTKTNFLYKMSLCQHDQIIGKDDSCIKCENGYVPSDDQTKCISAQSDLDKIEDELWNALNTKQILKQ